MDSFIQQHILSLRGFSRDNYLQLFETARALDQRYAKTRQLQLLQNKTLVTAFYQPSTRTRLASEAAMWQSGGRVLGFSDHRMTRAGDFYQESIKDTTHMLHCYGDLIAMRHFEQGAAAEAARWSKVPVINCGDGWGDHPTQVLVDLYTLWCRRGSLDGMTFLLVGDMRMRTMHSILHALSQFDSEAILVHPEGMALTQEQQAELQRMGVTYRFAESVEQALPQADLIYMEPVVQPDYTVSHQEGQSHYQPTPSEYRLDPGLYRARAKPDCLIVHSFARMDELPNDFDDHPNACYWEQGENGVVLRRALFALVLGAIES